MGGLVKLVGEGFDNISNPVIIAFVLIALGFIYITKSAWVKAIQNINFINLVKIFKGKKNKGIDSLKNHDVFTELEMVKAIHAPQFETHGKLDEVKSKIFKEFLDTKMDSTIQTMGYLVESTNEEMGKMDLKQHVNKSFINCNLNLEKVLKGKLVNRGLTMDQATEVVNVFFDIRAKTMDRYTKRFDSIFGSDFYDSNYHLLLAVNEVVAFEIDNIIKESIETFEIVNGMFIDLPYED